MYNNLHSNHRWIQRRVDDIGLYICLNGVICAHLESTRAIIISEQKNIVLHFLLDRILWKFMKIRREKRKENRENNIGLYDKPLFRHTPKTQRLAEQDLSKHNFFQEDMDEYSRYDENINLPMLLKSSECI